MKTILQNQLQIIIFRHGPNEKKIIYDSLNTNQQGTYPSLTGEKTDKELNAGPLGFLNPVPLAAQSFGLSAVSMLEFYTFSDLDKNKKPDTDYTYEVEFTFADPLYAFLQYAYILFNNAIEGNGTILGLNGLISLMAANTKNIDILNEAGSPYIDGTYLNLSPNPGSAIPIEGTQYMKEKPISSIVTDYDSRYNQDSFGISGQKDKILGTVEQVLATDFIPLLLNSQKEKVVIDSNEFNSAVRNALSLQDNEGVSLDNIVFIRNVFETLRNDLGNVIGGLSVANPSKGKGSNSTLNSTVSPSNSSVDKRKITAKKHFSCAIKKINHGFDYTAIFNGAQTPQPNSLKQISIGTFMETMGNMLSKYYSEETIVEDQVPIPQLPTAIGNHGYSFLPLSEAGVVIPESLKSSVDKNNWSNTLQSLLLYKKNKLAKMEKNNIFSYNVESTTSHYNKYVLNQNVKSGATIAAASETTDLDGLIKTERNQTLVGDLGLNIQDKTEIMQGVAIDERGQETELAAVETQTKSLSTDVLTNYFLSYVNNFSTGELGLFNLVSPSNIPPNVARHWPVQLLALVLFKQGFDGLGQPANNYTFESFYNALFGSESSLLYASRFAEYFFTFLNFVKIDYLDDFEKFNMNSATSDGPTAKTIANVDNVSIASAKWKRLSLKKALAIPDDKSILCRITNYKLPSFADNGIRRELEFYQNFNKYFLITGGNLNAATVNDFGSQLITKGFV